MSSDPKLNQITKDDAFRAKVDLVLEDLKGKKYDGFIAEAQRTVAQQREKVKKGYSKTMNSFHVKTGSDGGCKAADIVQRGKGWSASKRFWLILGSSAWAHNIGWGGLFGLNSKQVKAMQKAIHTLRQAGWPIEHEAYQVQMGWDVAHVEIKSNWPPFYS